MLNKSCKRVAPHDIERVNVLNDNQILVTLDNPRDLLRQRGAEPRFLGFKTF